MHFPTILSVAFSFAAAVLAQTSGSNPITYPLGGILDSSIPLTITWTPTTSGTITIRLLKGPPTNILDFDIIAASIENSGSFTWNMPKSLQDSSSMPKGDRYGFKIIDDLTNTFEYSPPFDISVSDSTFAASSQSSAVPVSTSSPEPTQVTSTSIESVESTPTSTAESTPTTSLGPTETPTASETIQQNVPVQTTLSTQTTSSTAPKPTGTKNTSSDNSTITANPGPNLGLIIGVAVGAFCGVALVILAIVMVCRRKNTRKRQSTSAVQELMVQANPRPVSGLVYGDGMYNKV